MPVFQVIVSEKAYYISSISNQIDIKVWRWKNFEMIVFQKDKKIPSFFQIKIAFIN